MALKNSAALAANVPTSVVRSRNRLPRSHEVSGANRQAWQHAPWTPRPSAVGQCSEHSGSEPQMRMDSKAC